MANTLNQERDKRRLRNNVYEDKSEILMAPINGNRWTLVMERF